MRGITSLFFFCLVIMGIQLLTNEAFADNAKNTNNASSTLSSDQIKQAAESGDPDAQYALGYMWYYGKGGLQRNIVEAKKWIAKAAENKQPQAIRAQKLMLAAEQKSKTTQSYPVANSNESTIQKNYTAHNESITQHVASLDNKKLLREKELEREAASETSKEVSKESHQETLVDMHNTDSKTKVSSSEKRLLAVPNHFYTVQLLAGENKDAVDKLMLKNDLKSKAAIYHTYRNAKLMYVLIYGQYETKEQARVVAIQLQKKLKLEPWIKSYASVKKSINNDKNT